MTDKLTETLAKATAIPARQQVILYDSELTGFGLRVTKAGTRSLILNYTLEGRERRLTIGRYPAWSVAAAREEARRLRRLIDQGKDPLSARQAARKAPTIKDLWEAYERDHLPKLAARSQADIRSMWAKVLLPKLGTVKLNELTATQVDEVHSIVSVDRPVRANRVLEVLRKALNLAARRGWVDKNPANGFHRNPEQPRSNYLDAEQLTRLIACLEKTKNQQVANVIRLLLLTGARLGEVLRADWTQFDLTAGVWSKPSSHTKQRKLHRVPLSVEAWKLVQQMAQARTAFFLFPNSKGAKPIADVTGAWGEIRKEAGLHGVRIHDLRHTYASLLVSAGESLPVIGRLLGHAQHQTTLRYAHLMDDPLRAATNRVAGLIGRGPTVESGAGDTVQPIGAPQASTAKGPVGGK